MLTLLLSGENRIFYYEGFAESGIHATDFSASGLRKILLERNAPQITMVNSLRRLLESEYITKEEFSKKVNEVKQDKHSLMVLIKPDKHSRYKNLIDVLDELYIANVGRFTVQDIYA